MWGMKHTHIVLVATLLFLSACSSSSFRNVRELSETDGDERVLIGEITYQDFSPRVRFGSLLMKCHLWGSYDLSRIEDGQRVEKSTAAANDGGLFSMVVEKEKPFYLRGLMCELRNGNQDFLPFPMRVDPGNDRCAYVGSIGVRKLGERLQVVVQDRFHQVKQRGIAAQVAGCKPVNLLATRVEE